MRPRIRTIKPDAALDEELWDLGQRTGLPVFQAFTILWCHCDREGRFEWRPRALKAVVLPYWEGDFEAILDALTADGFVRRYVVGGRAYGVVPTFKKHQAVNQRESPSTIPGPEEEDPPNTDPVAACEETPKSDDAHVPEQSGVSEVHVHARAESPRSIPIPIPFHSLPVPIPGGAGGRPPIAELAKAYARDPTLQQGNFGNPHEWPELVALWDAFRESWGREDRPLGPGDLRVRLALERFSEGRSVEDLTKAIRNSRNYRPIADNRSYQRLKTILRDTEQVDMLLTMDQPDVPRARGAAQPKQPDGGEWKPTVY